MFAGVGNLKLHTHAYVGTKRLIEEHTAQILRLLKVIIPKFSRLLSRLPPP
jgi:hypothetical protein